MEHTNKNMETLINQHHARKSFRKRLIGVVFIGAGVLWAMRSAGIEIPEWIFSWQMLLICIGLSGAISHGFRSGGWLIPIIIGVIFMLEEFAHLGNLRHYLFPAGLVVFGFLWVFRPRNSKGCGPRFVDRRGSVFGNEQFSSENQMEITSIFGGVQETVLSKDFKGGEIVAIFGGAEVNLLQADIQGTVTLDVVCALGGAKLLIPSNWLVKSEVTAIFGSVEDKRQLGTTADPGKVLILKGTAILGGIEIKSF